ncbi:MAG: hypothetical protein IJP92_04080 [Lachnospiraceae bacterium]|nr:hypothetical protein [Lachnospiraceae bacterium]
MNEERIRALFLRLEEIWRMDPRMAEYLLQQILLIVYEGKDGEGKK